MRSDKRDMLVDGFIVMRLTGTPVDSVFAGLDDPELEAADSVVVWWHISELLLLPYLPVVQPMDFAFDGDRHGALGGGAVTLQAARRGGGGGGGEGGGGRGGRGGQVGVALGPARAPAGMLRVLGGLRGLRGAGHRELHLELEVLQAVPDSCSAAAVGVHSKVPACPAR
eukprot:3435787-Pyramimonas_sp.AAC.1